MVPCMWLWHTEGLLQGHPCSICLPGHPASHYLQIYSLYPSAFHSFLIFQWRDFLKAIFFALLAQRILCLSTHHHCSAPCRLRLGTRLHFPHSHGTHTRYRSPPALVDGIHCHHRESALLSCPAGLGFPAHHAEGRRILLLPVPRIR